MAEKKAEKKKEEGFGGEVPLVGTLTRTAKKMGEVLRILLTDKGLYDDAVKRLNGIRAGAISKIRGMFRRR